MVDPSITASQGGAFKVAGVVSLLLVSLMAGCLFVARRRIPIPLDFARSSSVSRTSGSVLDFAKQVYARMTNAVRTPDERSDATRRGSRDNHFATSLAAVHARLVETELLVATLPPDLLLREVLQTELDGLRARGAEASRRAGQLDAKRSGALLRGMIKDLDRITRIVRGTARQEDSELSAGPIDPPSTIFEAYRVLGLNPDAPPAAVKKVVDALRMSWHPDHARSEADRQNREQRIKQINAAWDILKGSRVVAV
jgi:DnaJ-domain-containing protein 1